MGIRRERNYGPGKVAFPCRDPDKGFRELLFAWKFFGVCLINNLVLSCCGIFVIEMQRVGTVTNNDMYILVCSPLE